MYETLLVPLDGSEEAKVVLPYAQELASKFGSKIVLVRVFESKKASEDASYMDEILKQMHVGLSKQGNFLSICAENLVGKPAQAILDCADKNECNLIVVSSHGLSGHDMWSVGSIADKILRAASQPVMLIKDYPKKYVGGGLVKKILVPLDGSKPGETIIPYAEAMAAGLKAQLVLFSVIEQPITSWKGPGYDLTAEVKSDFEKHAGPMALAYLEKVAGNLKTRSLNVSKAVRIGYAADEILDFAATNDIDLIAMSTHGLSGIRKWVIGSVADKVLRAGDKPVLLTPASV